ncbi:DUF4097 domain-containing protein [bacterium]|nr:DUF4097 domain-containing protein [bacterium]
MSRATVSLVIAVFFGLLSVQASAAKTHRYNLDETYPIAADGTLYLSTDDAEVSIIGEDRDDVHVVVHHTWHISGVSSSGGEDFEIIVTEENGNLRIREADTGGITIMMGSIREEYTIDIHAPKTIDLRLRGEDDDYRVRNFSGDVRMDMEDGDALLLEMTGSHFELGVEDGRIDLNGGAGILDLFAEDGSITVENGKFKDVHGTVEDGEIVVETSLSDDGSYRMKADDGSVELRVLDGGGTFRLEYEDGGTRVGRDFELIDENDYYEEYELPGGEANVRMSVEDGRIILRN